MADNFTGDAVLLVGVCEGTERRRAELKEGSSGKWEYVLACVQAHVLVTKRAAAGGTGGVFAWPAEEEEPDDEHVCDA